MPRAVRDWISLSEAATIFADAIGPIRTITLARGARDGRLQSIRPGRRVYVRRAQVRALLRPRRGVPAEQLQPSLFGEWES
jgi:hypothetical protein